MRTLQQPPHSPTEPPGLLLSAADGRQFRFTKPFTVGRSADCDVCIDDSHVSRRHISVAFERGRWCVRDLQSSNGIFVDNKRVETAQIDKVLTLRLGGADGPVLVLQPETAVAATVRAPSRPARRRWLRTMPTGTSARKARTSRSDKRTLLIRKAFEKVQRKQKRRYGWIVATMTVVAVAARGLRVLRPSTDAPAAGAGRGVVLHDEVARRGHRQRRTAGRGVR